MAATRSRKWWFRFPWATYAFDFAFEEPVTQQAARAYARQWLSGGEKPKRLPRGTEVWPG